MLFQLPSMKTCSFLIFVIIFTLIFMKEIFSPNNFNFEIFSTARGEININEINENVFEMNGYTLIKNGLIPILKKKMAMKCEKVFSEWQKVADNGLTMNPPKQIPNPTEFLLNNYTKLQEAYFNETPKNTNQTLKHWSEKYVNELIKIAKENPLNLPGTYGNESIAVHYAVKYYSVKEQIGAVIGSQTPWAEVMLLANGAAHVTTVDYYPLTIEHPKIDFLYAPDLPSKKEKYYNKFDFIVSFSSIEHSGLGRYGDPIDPIGDIREMNKIHCMLKPNGLLYLGFPVGVDKIVYNAHRVYGRIRLAMMFEGFKLLKIYRQSNVVSAHHMQDILKDDTNQWQLLFVLQKMS